MTLPPFPPDYRASGVLLHVTSLPSPYGIGDVASAVAWIDRLREAGQSWWEALPRSFSSDAVDYAAVASFKHRLLEIGDLPFFVSPDSSDVWANPELFLLDEHRRPRFVAGVPPDYFSAEGQLWGNPVYDWDALRRTGYRWWLYRLRALLAHVDVVRLDHFRGFAAAWHVPAGAPTAQSGRWVPGPGNDLLSAVQNDLGALPFIAEDLGQITPDVYALRDRFGVPGTRVLQFAFDGHSDNPYLTSTYVANTVVYTGTHDNPTTREWYEEIPDDQRRNLWSSLKRLGGQP